MKNFNSSIHQYVIVSLMNSDAIEMRKQEKEKKSPNNSHKYQIQLLFIIFL